MEVKRLDQLEAHAVTYLHKDRRNINPTSLLCPNFSWNWLLCLTNPVSDTAANPDEGMLMMRYLEGRQWFLKDYAIAMYVCMFNLRFW